MESIIEKHEMNVQRVIQGMRNEFERKKIGDGNLWLECDDNELF